MKHQVNIFEVSLFQDIGQQKHVTQESKSEGMDKVCSLLAFGQFEM